MHELIFLWHNFMHFSLLIQAFITRTDSFGGLDTESPAPRGVQYGHCVMHKCIMVKVGGNEKHKVCKFYEIRGKFGK